MSVRLPPPASHSAGESDIDSTSESDNDQTWDDWVSDNAAQNCKSLFDDKVFPTVDAASQYDKDTHQFDLADVCKALCMYLVCVRALSLTFL